MKVLHVTILPLLAATGLAAAVAVPNVVERDPQATPAAVFGIVEKRDAEPAPLE